jgi:hypothetical protein
LNALSKQVAVGLKKAVNSLSSSIEANYKLQNYQPFLSNKKAASF